MNVLQEFGEPAALAAQYQPDRYVIGPRLFPIWRQVMSVVLIVLTVLHGVFLATLLLSQDGSNLPGATWKWLTTYVSSLLTTFGIVVLIFMGIERTVCSEIEAELGNGSEWDPLARVSVAIAGVVVTIALLVKIVCRLLADFSGSGGDGLSSLLTGRR